MNDYCNKLVQDMDKMLAAEYQGNKSFMYSARQIYEQGYIAGKEMERKLLRLRLGLATDEDTKE